MGNDVQVVYIALGANIGEREQALYQALSFLQEHEQVRIIRCSSIYETDPVGYGDQPIFLNMAACIHTSLQADKLLRVMLQVEEQMGRVRNIRWGPRIIDLDLLWMDNELWNTAELTLPHPRMGERAFVLMPLADIVSKFDVELHAFVYHALETLDGKDDIQKWSLCKWQGGFGLSASSGD